jgi:hypothetical protein
MEPFQIQNASRRQRSTTRDTARDTAGTLHTTLHTTLHRCEHVSRQGHAPETRRDAPRPAYCPCDPREVLEHAGMDRRRCRWRGGASGGAQAAELFVHDVLRASALSPFDPSSCEAREYCSPPCRVSVQRLGNLVEPAASARPRSWEPGQLAPASCSVQLPVPPELRIPIQTASIWRRRRIESLVRPRQHRPPDSAPGESPTRLGARPVASAVIPAP